jgi:hypothetical protein
MMNTISVNPGTIVAEMAAAPAGSKLLLDPGTYARLTVTKPLTVAGAVPGSVTMAGLEFSSLVPQRQGPISAADLILAGDLQIVGGWSGGGFTNIQCRGGGLTIEGTKDGLPGPRGLTVNGFLSVDSPGMGVLVGRAVNIDLIDCTVDRPGFGSASTTQYHGFYVNDNNATNVRVIRPVVLRAPNLAFRTGPSLIAQPFIWGCGNGIEADLGADIRDGVICHGATLNGSQGFGIQCKARGMAWIENMILANGSATTSGDCFGVCFNGARGASMHRTVVYNWPGRTGVGGGVRLFPPDRSYNNYDGKYVIADCEFQAIAGVAMLDDLTGMTDASAGNDPFCTPVRNTFSADAGWFSRGQTVARLAYPNPSVNPITPTVLDSIRAGHGPHAVALINAVRAGFGR